MKVTTLLNRLDKDGSHNIEDKSNILIESICYFLSDHIAFRYDTISNCSTIDEIDYQTRRLAIASTDNRNGNRIKDHTIDIWMVFSRSGIYIVGTLDMTSFSHGKIIFELPVGYDDTSLKAAKNAGFKVSNLGDNYDFTSTDIIQERYFGDERYYVGHGNSYSCTKKISTNLEISITIDYGMGNILEEIK